MAEIVTLDIWDARANTLSDMKITNEKKVAVSKNIPYLRVRCFMVNILIVSPENMLALHNTQKSASGTALFQVCYPAIVSCRNSR